MVGVVTGLAWTEVGGDILYIESVLTPGKGKVSLTGNLGDVMKESVQAAVSYLRTRAEQLHIPSDFYKTRDIHVHFPEVPCRRTARLPVSPYARRWPPRSAGRRSAVISP